MESIIGFINLIILSTSINHYQHLSTQKTLKNLYTMVPSSHLPSSSWCLAALATLGEAAVARLSAPRRGLDARPDAHGLGGRAQDAAGDGAASGGGGRAEGLLLGVSADLGRGV